MTDGLEQILMGIVQGACLVFWFWYLCWSVKKPDQADGRKN